MDDTATIIDQLTAELEIPRDGTLSRVIFKDGDVRVVIFGFDTDQELTEHTASRPAIVQIIVGRAHVALGDQETVLEPGGWVHMPAGLPHSVRALEPTVMLLTLLQRASG